MFHVKRSECGNSDLGFRKRESAETPLTVE